MKGKNLAAITIMLYNLPSLLVRCEVDNRKKNIGTEEDLEVRKTETSRNQQKPSPEIVQDNEYSRR